jgi:thiol:disulfide interchange protein
MIASRHSPMKAVFSIRFLLLVTVASVFFLIRAQAADPPDSGRPTIYDESADGSEQIAAALVVAKSENKRVLLQFGANWCPWCHLLHDLFVKDPAISEVLTTDYMVVLIDVNQGHNNVVDEVYGNPTRLGLPVLVVLDSDGKRLTTQNTGDLEEEDGHNPAKVLAFLEKWAPQSGHD